MPDMELTALLKKLTFFVPLTLPISRQSRYLAFNVHHLAITKGLNLTILKRKEFQSLYTQDLNCSRRGFLALAGAGLYSVRRAPTAFEGLTARQVIERIQKNVGVPWRSETVDTFKV